MKERTKKPKTLNCALVEATGKINIPWFRHNVHLLKESVHRLDCDTNNNSVVWIFCFSFLAVAKQSYRPLFAEAQRIIQSQQRWRGNDLVEYLHLCSSLLLLLRPEGARLYFSSRTLRAQSSSLLCLGKWQPGRQTGALHLVNPKGARQKTNGFGSGALPCSTWLFSHGHSDVVSWEM